MQATELVLDEIRRNFGGQRIYIQAYNGELKSIVRKEFNGRNFAELSRKHGISISTIRNYLKS